MKSTKTKIDSKLEAETQNPTRKDEHHFYGAMPSYSTEEATGSEMVFRTLNDFKDDSDDDEEISAELTEAGVNEPESAVDFSRDDSRSEDREFELSKVGNEESGRSMDDGGRELSEDDYDLDEIADRKPVKIGGTKVYQ